MAPCELTMSAGSHSMLMAVSESLSTMDCQNFFSRSMMVSLGVGMRFSSCHVCAHCDALAVARRSGRSFDPGRTVPTLLDCRGARPHRSDELCRTVG